MKISEVSSLGSLAFTPVTKPQAAATALRPAGAPTAPKYSAQSAIVGPSGKRLPPPTAPKLRTGPVGPARMSVPAISAKAAAAVGTAAKQASVQINSNKPAEVKQAAVKMAQAITSPAGQANGQVSTAQQVTQALPAAAAAPIVEAAKKAEAIQEQAVTAPPAEKAAAKAQADAVVAKAVQEATAPIVAAAVKNSPNPEKAAAEVEKVPEPTQAVTQQQAEIADAGSSSIPWVPILGGLAVVGGFFFWRRRSSRAAVKA